jgi:hypothetical protein
VQRHCAIRLRASARRTGAQTNTLAAQS